MLDDFCFRGFYEWDYRAVLVVSVWAGSKPASSASVYSSLVVNVESSPCTDGEALVDSDVADKAVAVCLSNLETYRRKEV